MVRTGQHYTPEISASTPVVAESAFGTVLRTLRERRELSLRDLGTLAEVDHAYISKIERGEKEPPPDETFGRIIRHLKAPPHEVALLRFLHVNNNVDTALALQALSDPEVTPDIMAIAVSVVHRGTGRPTPAQWLDRAKRAKRAMEE